MVKLVFCLHRLPALSREAFQSYWIEQHGPLVRSHAETLHIRRYVQVHSLTTGLDVGLRASRGGPEPYDGVAELWWDSIDDLMAGGATEEGRQAGMELLEDERTFIDLARSPLWLAEEHPIVGG
jgi:uncharacterized protein (TIGR02118 family)